MENKNNYVLLNIIPNCINCNCVAKIEDMVKSDEFRQKATEILEQLQEPILNIVKKYLKEETEKATMEGGARNTAQANQVQSNSCLPYLHQLTDLTNLNKGPSEGFSSLQYVHKYPRSLTDLLNSNQNDDRNEGKSKQKECRKINDL